MCVYLFVRGIFQRAFAVMLGYACVCFSFIRELKQNFGDAGSHIHTHTHTQISFCVATSTRTQTHSRTHNQNAGPLSAHSARDDGLFVRGVYVCMCVSVFGT